MVFGADLVVGDTRSSRPAYGQACQPTGLTELFTGNSAYIYTEAWLATGEKENSAVAFDYRLNFQ